MISEITKDSIDRHVLNGCPGGDFVEAILENNLKEAFRRADEENAQCMQDIVDYCYNKIPSACWGSKEKVRIWREKFCEVLATESGDKEGEK